MTDVLDALEQAADWINDQYDAHPRTIFSISVRSEGLMLSVRSFSRPTSTGLKKPKEHVHTEIVSYDELRGFHHPGEFLLHRLFTMMQYVEKAVA
jgi:hypothetical protein